jgi:hypothetical protein
MRWQHRQIDRWQTPNVTNSWWGEDDQKDPHEANPITFILSHCNRDCTWIIRHTERGHIYLTHHYETLALHKLYASISSVSYHNRITPRKQTKTRKIPLCSSARSTVPRDQPFHNLWKLIVPYSIIGIIEHRSCNTDSITHSARFMELATLFFCSCAVD